MDTSQASQAVVVSLPSRKHSRSTISKLVKRPCTPNTIDLLTNTKNTLRRLGDEGVSNRDNGRKVKG